MPVVSPSSEAEAELGVDALEPGLPKGARLRLREGVFGLLKEGGKER
jgi:hypothetical protein